MAELPKLNRAELEAVGARLHQLLGVPPGPHWGNAVAEFAGTVADLPEDLARNHDHYLHGAPKQ